MVVALPKVMVCVAPPIDTAPAAVLIMPFSVVALGAVAVKPAV